MRAFLFVLALSLSGVSWAIDPLPFAGRAEEVRFQQVLAELRCLQCQNQNLADSNAPLAKDMRQQVFDMMRAGDSDADIKRFMTDRYGPFALYRPPFEPRTWALWLTPIGALLIGVLLVWQSRRVKRSPTTGSRASQHDQDW